ncbi:MAG TPA: sigma-54-dependent Fis family transcriptional regulator, partial [Desulfobacterales bacterium]|nr:sigma-54-dependent Fis family transcriptional regulator [Desulfobacterales bacterium]
SKNHDIEVGLLYNATTGNGWNMIACPNNADYYWDNVEVLEYDADGNIAYGPTAISDLPDPNPHIDKRLWRWDSGTYYSDATLMEKHDGYWVRAKRANVFLRFLEAEQLAGLGNPGTTFASLFNRGKRWIKRWVFAPEVAIADSGDSPPAPMADFVASTGHRSEGDGGGLFHRGSCLLTKEDSAVWRGKMTYAPKILIVDDEPRMCDTLDTLLSGAGYETHTGTSGKDAVECLAKDCVDLVLLDIVMPDMDGRQVMHYINSQALETPVIVMTGHASIESAVEALRNGAHDYLRKPFEYEELLNTVENALKQKRLESESKEMEKALRESE